MAYYGHEANLHAAELAEKEGEYRKAYGFYKECLVQVERYESNNHQLISFLERKIDECEEKM